VYYKNQSSIVAATFSAASAFFSSALKFDGFVWIVGMIKVSSAPLRKAVEHVGQQ